MTKDGSSAKGGNGSTSTTPIVGKIEELEELIIEGKVTLVDDDGKPLKKVDLKEKAHDTTTKPSSSSYPYSMVGNPFSKVGDVIVSDSDDEEVLEPDNPMAKFLASTGGGHELEDYYDDYADQVYDLPGQLDDFSDMYDIKLQGSGNKQSRR